MSIARRILFGLPLALLAGGRAASAADPAGAHIERFYDALLAVMKEAERLSFDERYKRLAPTIGQTFDLGLMTRLALGAHIERFYDALLAVMKEAKRLSFDERYKRLAPTIGQTFDLGLMTRLAIG